MKERLRSGRQWQVRGNAVARGRVAGSFLPHGLSVLLWFVATSAGRTREIQVTLPAGIGVNMRHTAYADGRSGFTYLEDATAARIFAMIEAGSEPAVEAIEVTSDIPYQFLCDDAESIAGFAFGAVSCKVARRAFPSGDFIEGAIFDCSEVQVSSLLPNRGAVVLTKSGDSDACVGMFSTGGDEVWASLIEFGSPHTGVTFDPFGPADKKGVWIEASKSDGSKTNAYVENGELKFAFDLLLGPGDPPPNYAREQFAPENWRNGFVSTCQVVSNDGVPGTFVTTRDSQGQVIDSSLWSGLSLALTEAGTTASGTPWLFLLCDRTDDENFGNKALAAVNQTSGQVSAIDIGWFGGQWYGGECSADGTCAFSLRDFFTNEQRIVRCSLDPVNGITSPKMFRRVDSIDLLNFNLLCDSGASPCAARVKAEPHRAELFTELDSLIASGLIDNVCPVEFLGEERAIELFDPDLLTGPVDFVLSPVNTTVTAQPCTEFASVVTKSISAPDLELFGRAIREVTAIAIAEGFRPPSVPNISIIPVGHDPGNAPADFVISWPREDGVEYLVEELDEEGRVTATFGSASIGLEEDGMLAFYGLATKKTQLFRVVARWP